LAEGEVNVIEKSTVRHYFSWCLALAGVGLLLFIVGARAGLASPAEDKKAVEELDIAYQKAVEKGDTQTMAKILADDFVLVEGDGKRSSKTDLIEDLKSGKSHYQHQVDSERTVVVWGDTAVLTAKLYVKGVEDGARSDYFMWFSDTYVRTPKGWSYVFGQASLPMPNSAHK
jgi:ketosteroid isomerase-like protein